MIVEPDRKDIAEQHSYAEIPDTEILMKIIYLGIHRLGSDSILLYSSAIVTRIRNIRNIKIGS